MPTLADIKSFVTGDTLNWGAFAAIAVILVCIAWLMPKNKTVALVERIIVIVAATAVVLVPCFVDLGFDGKYMMFQKGFVAYMVLALAVILLYGIFTNDSYLTQGLYGVIISLALPFGLINLVFPVWAKSKTIAQLFGNSEEVVKLLMYAALFFIPVWLIRTGAYKVRVSSVWHVLGGMALGASVAVFAWEAKLVDSYTVGRLVTIFSGEKIHTGLLKSAAIVVGIFLGIILLIGIIATVGRKVIYKSDERVFVSETGAGFIIRLVGRLLAVAVCAGGALYLPKLLDAATVNTLTGMPKALLFLVPALLFAVIVFFSEFFAESGEIKVAMAAAAANDAAVADEVAEPVYYDEPAVDTADAQTEETSYEQYEETDGQTDAEYAEATETAETAETAESGEPVEAEETAEVTETAETVEADEVAEATDAAETAEVTETAEDVETAEAVETVEAVEDDTKPRE